MKLSIECLKEELFRGNVIAFVGAGVSMAATNGNKYAGWKGLIEEGVQYCMATNPGLDKTWEDSIYNRINSQDFDSFMSGVSEIDKRLRKANKLSTWLRQTIGELKCLNSNVIQAILDLSIPIVTTNYDSLIEDISGYKETTWKQPNNFKEALRKPENGKTNYIFHIHGYWDKPETIILGETSYQNILNDEFAQSILRAIGSLKTILFIGFGDGINDPNFASLIEWIKRVYKDSSVTHYKLIKTPKNDAATHDYNDNKIEMIEYGNKHEDLVPFLRSLNVTPVAGIENNILAVQNNASAPPGLSYLNWLIQEHSYIRLQGIHSATKHRGVKLERVYVALRGEKSSSYEKQKTKDLNRNNLIRQVGEDFFITLSEEEAYGYYLDMLQEDPVMPALAARDKVPNEYEIPITIGEAFTEERFLIILGDPGSGKTTIAKWLTLNLAKSYKEHLISGQPEFVELPEHQIDPYFDVTEITYNLGPSRFPILISISDYAQYYTEHADKPNGKRIKLIDYLGQHKWQGKQPTNVNESVIAESELQDVFKTYLRMGKAVVILDGMDEVTKYRASIVSEIEKFVDKWVIGKGQEFQDDLLNWNNFNYNKPGEVGGNQIVLTSRIVGYHLCPILKGITHVTIEPMKKKAIARFCDMWLRELAKIEFHSTEDDKYIDRLIESESGKLKNAIFNDKQILELASNPLLITIIALVFRNNDGRLPSHRAALYKEALVTLIKTWKQPGLSLKEVEYVLSAVASVIHIKYPKGIIKYEELRIIIETNLLEYRGIDLSKASPKFQDDFQEEVDSLITEIENKVGIIAPRGYKSFGFIHLTFQEYLAALIITRNQVDTSENIQKYVDDPRWKIPFMMALGNISIDEKWSAEMVNDLLLTIANKDSEINKFFPKNSLILAQAFAEISLEKISDSVIEAVLLKLLDFIADKNNIARFHDIRKRIEKSFHFIQGSEKGEFLENWIAKLLSAPSKKQEHLINAVVSIIAENRWFSKKISQALFNALKYDNKEWNWIINNTLMKLISDELRIKEKPKEPKPPLTPKVRFEKAVKKHQEDLLDLASGALKARVESNIKTLKLNWSIVQVKAEIIAINERILDLKSARENNLKIIEKILNRTLEKDLQEISSMMIDKQKKLFRKSSSKDILGNTHKSLKQEEEKIKILLNKLAAGNLSAEINDRVKILEKNIKRYENNYKHADKRLKDMLYEKEYQDFQRNLTPSRSRVVPSDDLLIDLVSDINLKTSINEFHLEAEKCQKEFAKEKARLNRIEMGQERQTLIEKIDAIRKEIKSEQLPADEYRIELIKYNYAFQYYEEATKKFNDQIFADLSLSNLAHEESTNLISLKNIRDYLLYTILFGGYRYFSQIEYHKKYKETAFFLQENDSTREYIVKQNPKYYYGKYGTEDYVYNAVVALSDGILKLDDFRTVSIKNPPEPKFEKHCIYRTSTIDLKQLLELSSAETKQISQYTDKIEAIDAMICIIFSQTDVKKSISILNNFEFKESVLAKLHAIKSTLNESVLLSHKLVITALSELASDDWFQVYSTLFKSILSANKSPVSIHELVEKAPEKYKGIVLADHWYSTSVMENYDPVRKYTEMLDAYRTQEWANYVKEALLQISYTPTYNSAKFINNSDNWLVAEYVSCDLFRSNELPLDVLYALENYRLFYNVRFDIAERFKKTYLNQLINAFITLEHPQRAELTLFCLQNNLFDSGLEDFLPSDIRSLNYLEKELLPTILIQNDAFFKARGLIRFLPYAADKGIISDQLSEAFELIKDPFEKIQILILLSQKNISLPQLNDTQIFVDSLLIIDEPLKFIKSFLDGHAIFLNLKNLTDAINKFMEMVHNIKDNNLKGRILRDTFKKRIDPNLNELIRNYLKQNFQDKEYAIGAGLYGLYLVLNDNILIDQKRYPEKWTPILLYSAIDDLIEYFSPSESANLAKDLWNDLWKTPSNKTVTELLKEGVASGLELHLHAANVIDHLISKEVAPIIYPLLPLLKANTSSMVVIEKWLGSSDTQIKKYAGLYHAEFYNRISEKNIDHVLDLDSSSDPRTHNRVSTILCGGVTNVKRITPRLYKMSELGIGVISKIIRTIKSIESRHEKSYTEFIFQDMEIDSIELTNKLLENDEIAVVIEHANELTEEVEDCLVQYLENKDNASTNNIDSIIDLIIQNIAEHEENDQRIYKKLHHVLINKYHEELSDYKFLPNNVFDLLSCYEPGNTMSTSEVRKKINEKVANLYNVLCDLRDEKIKINEDHIQKGLLSAYGYNYTTNYIFREPNEIKNIELNYSDKKYEFFIDWFLAESNTPKSQKKDLQKIEKNLLIVIAIWTRDENSAILNAKNADNKLYKSLTTSLKGSGCYAAINILAYINNHTKKGILGIISCIHKRPHIQSAVIDTMRKIKYVNEEILNFLLSDLLLVDPLTSCIYITILSNYANDSNTNPSIRQRILASLIACLEDDKIKRGVYRLVGNGSLDSKIRIEYAGQLDDIILKSIVEISNI